MKKDYLRMVDLDLAGSRVMIREDFNVPVEQGRISSDARIRAAVPTIQHAREQGAAVILLSHLGRPSEGEFDHHFSLQPVADRLSDLMGRDVKLVSDWLSGVDVEPGQVVLCENVRFNAGEKSNDLELAKRMARLCDVFVMDAFGTAHRAQASTEGVARYASVACAGPLLDKELESLGRAMQDPQRPLLAIVGGAKVSGKLTVLDALLSKVDQLIIGGGIANTFIAAEGHEVGASLYEPGLIGQARQLLHQARSQGSYIPIPKDVCVAKSFSAEAEARVCDIDQVKHDELILDIGPLTRSEYAEIIWGAGTVIWNGPVGVFEFKHFSAGTRSVAEAVADSDCYSIAGGGDTLAAIDQFGVRDRISYISTGGGAFLEYVEGKQLPAVTMLTARAT